MPPETNLTEAEIARRKLSERLRAHVLPLWQRQREHPFVVALGNGSLPRANFEFYIRQDALFLDELTKTFAYEIFLISTRYEWLFWEMAWHLEEWPS
jgi:thiaminase